MPYISRTRLAQLEAAAARTEPAEPAEAPRAYSLREYPSFKLSANAIKATSDPGLTFNFGAADSVDLTELSRKHKQDREHAAALAAERERGRAALNLVIEHFALGGQYPIGGTVGDTLGAYIEVSIGRPGRAGHYDTAQFVKDLTLAKAARDAKRAKHEANSRLNGEFN